MTVPVTRLISRTVVRVARSNHRARVATLQNAGTGSQIKIAHLDVAAVALGAALHDCEDVFVGYRRRLREQADASHRGQKQPLSYTIRIRQVSHFHEI